MLRSEIFHCFTLKADEVPDIKVHQVLDFAEDNDICNALDFYRDVEEEFGGRQNENSLLANNSQNQNDRNA
jgi:hypothetical protein